MADDFDDVERDIEEMFAGDFSKDVAEVERLLGDSPADVEDVTGEKPGRERKGGPGTFTPPDGTVDIVLNVPAEHAPAVKRWLANGEYTVSQGYGRGVLRRMGVLTCGAREGYAPTVDEEDIEFSEDLPDWLQTGGPEWSPERG